MWCHLEADTLEELHQFAQRLGLKREWFQDKPAHPHYDITSSVRQRAVRLGAIEMSNEQMVTFWKRQSDARRAGRCKSSTDAGELPHLASLFGAVPDFTGDMSVEEYPNRRRDE